MWASDIIKRNERINGGKKKEKLSKRTRWMLSSSVPTYTFCRTPRVTNSCSRASSKSASSYRQRCCGGATCDSRRQLISASLFFYSPKLPLLKSNQHRSERIRDRKERVFEYFFYFILCLWSVWLWRNVDFLSFIKPSRFCFVEEPGNNVELSQWSPVHFPWFYMEWMVEQVTFLKPFFRVSLFLECYPFYLKKKSIRYVAIFLFLTISSICV